MSKRGWRSRARSTLSFASAEIPASAMAHAYPARGPPAPERAGEFGGARGPGGSAGPAHLVGLEALGADVEALGNPVHQDSQSLDVRVVAPAAAPVGARYAVAEPGGLAAAVAYGGHNGGKRYQSPRARPT